MATAEQHLAQFNVSMAEARAFVNANLNNPQEIFNVAAQFGVTNAMLGEIAGGGTPYSAAEVVAFFEFNGINSRGLDPVVITPPVITPPPTGPGGGFDLFPQEWLGIASSLIALNTETGILSNDSIRAQVLSNPGISEAEYFAALNPANWAAPEVLADGIFSTAELGFSHLGDLSATAQTVESLLYGSIIKVVKSVDLNEAMMLENFVTANETALSNLDPAVTNQLIGLLTDVLSTPANPPLVSDEDLSQGLGFAAVALSGVLQTGTLPSLDDFF